MNSSTPEPYRRRDYAIRLHRAAGRVGKEYTVTILGDRSVTFVATSNALGDTQCCDFVRKRTLSVEDYDKLVERIDGMKFDELEANYPLVDGHFVAVMDSSAAITTVSGPFGTHAIDRSEIEPCETEFRKERSNHPPTPPVEVTRKDGKVISLEDPLERAVPAPDSVCELESAIDRVTGADKWYQELYDEAIKATTRSPR